MRILFLCICLFFSYSLSAQTGDSMTNDFLKHARAVYKEPFGYTEVDSLKKMYVPFPGNYMGLIPVNLTNNTRDILIGLFFTPYKETSESRKKLMLKMYNAANPNNQKTREDFGDLANQWKNIIKVNIDSLQGIAKGMCEFYERKSNTDTVVVFPMKITNPYHDKYTKCKYVITHKKDRGIARIYYFYTDAIDPKIIDKEIIKTLGLVRFKE